MNDTNAGNAPRPCWFVGANYGGTDDQTSRFLEEGIWENGYDDKYQELVRGMQPGERIAIKAAYTRKHGLPFDNRGHRVSVMRIKATGTIAENLNDGKRVRVDWTEQTPPREWYFHTNQNTVWRVLPSDWKKDNLIAFAFEEEPQDVTRFRNSPFWRDRFGDRPEEQRFLWTRFYEAVAERLLGYQNDRSPLIEGIHEIASRVELLSYLQDRDSPDGDPYPLKDICPFTAMGIFNRYVTDSNRRKIAAELARLLGVDVEVPGSFEGVPKVNNQNSWFFRYSYRREDGDVDALWDMFAAAGRFAGSDRPEHREAFIRAYETASNISGVRWNLSIGLYWTHPWDFPTLDGPSRNYIKERLGVDLPDNSAESYVTLIDDLNDRFSDESCPVHSFPELSLAADEAAKAAGEPGVTASAETIADETGDDGEDDRSPGRVRDAPPFESYSVDGILGDGCFLEKDEVEGLIDLLRDKKNLILQGPPGTGKTWIATRLAFALMGKKDDTKVRRVQFHPNLSYEDFVRGWRPSGDGRLVIEDGVFMQAVRQASGDPSSKFAVVIEEINRGNPARIFGELLTLLEADKRTPEAAVELCYPDPDGGRGPVHLPGNLHVIGTMNTADRSLALIDFAFRRRFAFAALEPKLGDKWREWVVAERGVDGALAREIERRVTELNQGIADDGRLGAQFRMGHSFVTPARRLEDGETKDWFEKIVKSEIGPLLEEYWFDSPQTATNAVRRLLEGW